MLNRSKMWGNVSPRNLSLHIFRILLLNVTPNCPLSKTKSHPNSSTPGQLFDCHNTSHPFSPREVACVWASVLVVQSVKWAVTVCVCVFFLFVFKKKCQVTRYTLILDWGGFYRLWDGPWRSHLRGSIMTKEILREASQRASSILTDYNSALISTQNIW